MNFLANLDKGFLLNHAKKEVLIRIDCLGLSCTHNEEDSNGERQKHKKSAQIRKNIVFYSFNFEIIVPFLEHKNQHYY